MAEVYSLSGEPLHVCENPNEPVPGLVEAIERLLEQARSGEVRGFLCVYTHSDGATGGFTAGIPSYSIVGRMEEAKLDMLQDLA